MKKNRLIALSAAVVLSATAVVGGTLAYFTDKDDAKNTFTFGNVEIALHEDNGLEMGDANYKADKTYRDWLSTKEQVPGATIAKEVTVENKGSMDAYLWTEVLVPVKLEEGTKASLHLGYAANVSVVEPSTTETIVNEEDNTETTYNVYKCYIPNSAATASGAIAGNFLESMTIDGAVKQCNDATHNTEKTKCYVLANGTHYNDTWEVLVRAYGIQSEGFDNITDAINAYHE